MRWHSTAGTPKHRESVSAPPPVRACRLAAVVVLALAGALRGQEPLDGRDGRPLLLDRFRPQSQLVLPRSEAPRAKFPVIDVHVHPRIRLRHAPGPLAGFVEVMDDQNIALCVSLDGGLGERLEEHLAYLEPFEDRFLVFANVDWQGAGRENDPATWDCHRPGFGRRTARRLAEAKRIGAVGLKIFKMLGLSYKNPDGSLVAIDDPRWDPIWTACGDLGMPVIIHSADPVAFFEPIDERNERWEELHRHPDWSFHGPAFPSHDELLAARNRVIARHPETTFIGAHMANYPENLARVDEWLKRYPNLVVEISSRIGELGRQPYTTRRFFLKHQDRIMFGTDGPRAKGRLLPHWRFFQTRDEYFPYAENPFPPQGLWNIHGIGLPDHVLKKLYHENACRVIPGAKKLFARHARNRGPLSRDAADDPVGGVHVPAAAPPVDAPPPQSKRVGATPRPACKAAPRSRVATRCCPHAASAVNRLTTSVGLHFCPRRRRTAVPVGLSTIDAPTDVRSCCSTPRRNHAPGRSRR